MKVRKHYERTANASKDLRSLSLHLTLPLPLYVRACVCLFFYFVFASSFSIFAQKAEQKSNKFRHWKETKSRIELKEESHRRKYAQVCVPCMCVCVCFVSIEGTMISQKFPQLFGIHEMIPGMPKYFFFLGILSLLEYTYICIIYIHMYIYTYMYIYIHMYVYSSIYV